MAQILRYFCAAVVIVAVAACSTDRLADPIDKFAAATTQADQALGKYDAALVARLTERARTIALANRSSVDFEGKCATTQETKIPGCHLVVTDKGRTRQLAPDAALPQHLALSRKLSDYAKNLAAITRAGDKTGIQASVNATKNSLVNIATTVDPTANTAIASPAADAANWLIGQYIDYLKFDALKNATSTAEPLVQKSRVFLGQIAATARNDQIGVISNRTITAMQKFNQSGSPGDLDVLQRSTVEYDAVLRSPESGGFDAFAAAHHSLYRALNEGPQDFTEFFARVEDLERQASELVKIADAIEKASSK